MKDLLHAATLGTARVPAPPGTGWPVDALVGSADPPEQRLLLLAGASAAFRTAGALAATATALPPATSDPRPPCSPTVAGLLRDLLEMRDLLDEAFARLKAAGQRLPHALLPAFLEMPNARQVPLLRAALGARGRWLAALRPDWGWALAPEDAAEEVPDAERLFEEGTPEQRRAALRACRRTAPDTGRAWLEKVWRQEKADVRTAFLEDLATGLGPADEPFLEAALDDRSMGVRAAAAQLLARIPGSALSQRMVARADAMLAWEAPKGIGGFLKSALGRKGGLAVNPPQKIDASWTRDGIGGKPPSWLGERAHWLSQVLACVDPKHWERLAAPADFAAALWRTDWGLAVLLGLVRATQQHRAGAWAGPLLDALTATPKGTPEFPVTETVRDLVHAMPASDLAPRVLRALDGDDPLGLASMLPLLPVPWPAQVGRRYLEGVRGQVKAAKGELFDHLHSAARALPPELLGQVPDLEVAPDAPPWVRTRVEGFRNIVRLRRRIHQEIVP